jgi:hypothetical protein
MLNLFLLGKKVTKNNPTSTRSLDQDKNTQKIKNQKTIHQSAQKQKGAALSYPFYLTNRLYHRKKPSTPLKTPVA